MSFRQHSPDVDSFSMWGNTWGAVSQDKRHWELRSILRALPMLNLVMMIMMMVVVVVMMVALSLLNMVMIYI